MGAGRPAHGAHDSTVRCDLRQAHLSGIFQPDSWANIIGVNASASPIVGGLRGWRSGYR